MHSNCMNPLLMIKFWSQIFSVDSQTFEAHCIWERKQRGEKSSSEAYVCSEAVASSLTLTVLLGFQLLSLSLSFCQSCFNSLCPSCAGFIWITQKFSLHLLFSSFQNFALYPLITCFIILYSDLWLVILSMWLSGFSRWRLSVWTAVIAASSSDPHSVMGAFLRLNHF